MKQIRTFANLRKYLQSIPNIDNGGCAIAALTMHRWLKKQGKVSEIVYFYGEHSLNAMKENNSLKLHGKGVPMSCSHAYIKYRNQYYDSDGMIDDPRLHHTLTEEIVVQTINNLDFGSWNDDFDRKKFIPQIEIRTEINLKDIEL